MAMRSGLHPWCRECVRSYNLAWRVANAGSVEEYNRLRREEYAAERGPLERVCANPECGRVFAKSRRDAKTCSRVCRSRLSQLQRTERNGERREGAT
jgi:hypothetical protein